MVKDLTLLQLAVIVPVTVWRVLMTVIALVSARTLKMKKLLLLTS